MMQEAMHETLEGWMIYFSSTLTRNVSYCLHCSQYVKLLTYQLAVVVSQLVRVGVGEEQQLGVGVDGDVGLNAGLVLADEISHILDLDLRLRLVPTEGVTAGVAGGSHGCHKNNIIENG